MVKARSEPEILNVIDELSTSSAVTEPIVIWFSSASKLAKEVNVGFSLTSVTFTVIFWEDELIPSLAVRVAE